MHPEAPQTKHPTAELAGGIAAQSTGYAPTTVRRFKTGARHYVFDIAFADRPPVVVRIGGRSAQSGMAGAIHLSELLRPRGVKLPEVLASDVRAEFPWLLLERLPGTDLGAVISGLADGQSDRIAAAVAHAQAVVAQTDRAGRYGYAVLPDQAPHTAWSQVLAASLARSRRRIGSAGLFDTGSVDAVQAVLTVVRDEIDRIAPTPFMHDTTTRNVIVTVEGTFSGIVDVDDLCFGDPRCPAALTMAVLMAYGRPVRYVSAWLRHAGLEDDRVFRLYVTLFLLDLMSEHGQVFKCNEHPSSPDGRAALHRAFVASLAGVRA